MRSLVFAACCLLSGCASSEPTTYSLRDGPRVQIDDAAVKEVRRFGSGFDTFGGYIVSITVALSPDLPDVTITGHPSGRVASVRALQSVCETADTASNGDALRVPVELFVLRDFMGTDVNAAEQAYLLAPRASCAGILSEHEQPYYLICQGEGSSARCAREQKLQTVFAHYILNGALLPRAAEIDKQVSELLAARVAVLGEDRR